MSNTMREILFRGKREVDNVWVYGVPYDNYIIREIDWRYEYPEAILYAIRHETVGQFTDLTDKNGNKIFEGDIIKTKKYGKIVGHSNVNSYDIFAVEYEPAVFRLVNHSRGFNLVGNGTDYEVIGNIHDNPELLEKNNENT